MKIESIDFTDEKQLIKLIEVVITYCAAMKHKPLPAPDRENLKKLEESAEWDLKRLQADIKSLQK